MSTDKIREVRSRSGVGLNDCRMALDEAGGDVEKAIELLLKKGLTKAADRAGRIATNGRVQTYVHGNGSKVAVVEVNCETDFAANSDAFKEFCHEVAMHVVASAPNHLDRESVGEAVVIYHRSIFMQQVPKDKPFEAQVKIVDGKMNKWFTENCLLEQESVVHPGKSIDQLRVELIAKLGENVQIRRFICWEVGGVLV